MLRRIASALIPIALIALVVLPLALDQPFGTQTARTLEAIYAMRRWSPIVTVLGLAALAVLAAISLRRRRTWLSLVGFAGVLTLAIAAAWFARQNHFEWMFNPLPQPRLRRRPRKATFVDAGRSGDGRVDVDGDAVAYPIRQIGYHHVVNDGIGGTPSSPRIERSVTPVWCGDRRSTDGGSRSVSPASTTRTSSCGTSRPAPGGSR